MDVEDLENMDLIMADEQELLHGSEEAEMDDSHMDDDDNDQVPRRVEPKKRKLVQNPQPKLDAERLKGPRGLGILEDWFKDVKLKGKGKEKQDLDEIMARMELWTHRLYPKYTFDDTLCKIEKLGHKSQVKTHVKRIRLDLEGEDTTLRGDDSVMHEDPINISDAFDDLIQPDMSMHVPAVQPTATLSNEDRERILRNRLLAEERRMARMKARMAEEGKTEASQVLTTYGEEEEVQHLDI